MRYYMCGEYGEETGRPHYHVCLFGFDFADDRTVWRRRNGFDLYRSPRLEILWPFGHSTVGPLNFETAAYCARYVMKKITGDAAEEHYKVVDPDTGEVSWRAPEFNRMSLKPGIGSNFVDQFMSDIYPHDYLVINGKKSKPPRYYDKRFEAVDPDAFENLKGDREVRAAANAADNSIRRLAAKEAVMTGLLNLKSRKL